MKSIMKEHIDKSSINARTGLEKNAPSEKQKYMLLGCLGSPAGEMPI